MRLSVSIIAVILIVTLGVVTFFWSGQFNISADTPHWSITKSVLDSIREKSLNNAADSIQVPDNINDESYYVQGVEHYQAMCVSCHLAPGKNESELRMGLYPRPPAFADVEPPEPKKTFWIIKHGLKMTGMPAWGKSHSDEEIWKVTAFIHQLQDMDKARYTELVTQYGGGHSHNNGSSHEHNMHSDENNGGMPDHHDDSVNEQGGTHQEGGHEHHDHAH